MLRSHSLSPERVFCLILNDHPAFGTPPVQEGPPAADTFVTGKSQNTHLVRRFRDATFLIWTAVPGQEGRARLHLAGPPPYALLHVTDLEISSPCSPGSRTTDRR